MTTGLQRRMASMFKRTRQQTNNPSMLVIGPITSWVLPAGYSYDDDTDTIRNGAGQVLADPSTYWVATTVEIVAQGYQAGGQQPATLERATNEATNYVWIKPGDSAAVAAAWAVRLSGHLYDVTAVDAFPAGTATPAIFRVTLERRRENRTIWTGWEQAWRPR